MKNLLVSISVLFFGTGSFAANVVMHKLDDFNSQAIELLVKNVDSIKLEGDIFPDEKLKPILDELGEFLVTKIFPFDDDPDDYKGPIKSFTADCKQLTVRGLTAKCELFIQYKPIGETGIVFYLGLDNDKRPQSILENRVRISRGD